MSLQKELLKIYGNKGQERDVFGRRPATPEDFGRSTPTPKQIADHLHPEEASFENLLNQYMPTTKDIEDKG